MSTLLIRTTATLALLLAGTAQADRVAISALPAYHAECAACHMAYPPGLLPAASWQRLMANLPKHFGSDASVDPATLKLLSDHLVANAGTFKKVARDPSPPPEDRISRAPWFVREHREIDPATWKRKAIGSASNCTACHTQATQGSFSEHDIRIPQ
jgi:hypothetical protein